jgi:hypothetical protein
MNACNIHWHSIQSKPLKGLKENTSVYQSLYVIMGHHMRKKREAVAKYENKLNKTLRKIPLTADVPSAAFINDTQASKSPALLSHNNRTLVLKKSGREANSHVQCIVQSTNCRQMGRDKRFHQIT